MRSSQSKSQQVTQEETDRRTVRSSLTQWARFALQPLGQSPATHHHLLIDELAKVASGETDRLMLLLPPGSAKSTYASILFPAWWFTQHSKSSVIAASHTADLAHHFGRQVRDLVNEQHAHLGYTLADHNRAAGRWRTSSGGEYFAVGLRGPVTGRRADLAIIDDPIKSYAEADSVNHRDLVWNWFRSDLVTRLKPKGRVILIMTRWHEDDLGGRLLSRQEGQWRVLRLPALAEPEDPLNRPEGAPLWPEWEDEGALQQKRTTVGERVWSAMYQQTPRSAQGTLFSVKPIDIMDSLPLSGHSVRAWDLASTFKQSDNDPDWTVGIKLHRNDRRHFTITDVVRIQGSPHQVEDIVLETAKLDGRSVTISLPKDPGAAGGFVASYLAGQLAGHNLIITPETGPKISRATPVAAQIEAGNVSIVRASWNHAFLEELRDFPHGVKDDQVDALSRAFTALLDQAAPARRMTVPFLAR
jgi:predicted phage terminase large subunit-like protein